MAEVNPWLEQKRAYFILRRLSEHGKIGREDVRAECSVSAATASAIFRRLQDKYKGAVIYDFSEKNFVKGPRFTKWWAEVQKLEFPVQAEQGGQALGFD